MATAFACVLKGHGSVIFVPSAAKRNWPVTRRQSSYRGDKTLRLFKHAPLHVIGNNNYRNNLYRAYIVSPVNMSLLPGKTNPHGNCEPSNSRIVSGVTKKPGSVTALKQRADNKYVPQGRKAPPPVVGAGSSMLASARSGSKWVTATACSPKALFCAFVGRPTLSSRKAGSCAGSNFGDSIIVGMAVQRRCSIRWTGMTAGESVVALTTLFRCWFQSASTDVP